jgi:Mg-chelatase subunit ChlD
MKVLLALLVLIQDATTNAGVHRSSLLVKSGHLPKPEEIRVYDFINYHKHAEIAEPKTGVTLDARWLAPLPNAECDAALQIGLRTPSLSKEMLPTMNLVVVIDRSGSMAGSGKMDFVKQGLKMLVAQMKQDDFLSIVVFDTDAQVLRAAGPVNDVQAVNQLIEQIQPGGGTNLHGGLMLGYQEALKHAGGKMFSKVLLLSDGQTNHGVTDPERIVADSKSFNDKGIALSTIGIGLDYNDALMSQLAKTGSGTYHFLDSGDAVERTFFKELQSLMAPIGTSPVLRVRLAAGVSLKKVYGYEFASPEPGVFEFKLLDLPVSTSQIIPMEVHVPADVGSIGEVELAYTAKERVKVTAPIEVKRGDGGGDIDPAVMKNFTIARMAQAFREACAAKERQVARDGLTDILYKARTAYPDPKDEDLKRMFKIVEEALEVCKSN